MTADDYAGRSIRIPLPGNPEGIVLLLPDKQLTSLEWDIFKNVLGAMRPALVDDLLEDES
jgi:hypothetical protein